MERSGIIAMMVTMLATGCLPDRSAPVENADRTPEIYPDYRNVTVPSNIAPLNFRIEEEVERSFITLGGPDFQFELKTKGNRIIIPEKKWKRLLAENSGGNIKIALKVYRQGKWVGFDPFIIHVSEFPSDDYLVYRLIMPGYQNWNRMGIYQRPVSSFKKKTIIDSRVLPGTCMNCHSFAGNDPRNMVFHLREAYGGTMLYRNNKLEKLNTRTGKMFGNAAFPSWHPSGKYIAFSVNRVNQVFHAAGSFRAAAVDLRSDIFVYNIEKNEMLTSFALSAGDNFESFPCFSADGTILYYCSADSVKLPQKFDSIRYSLCALRFDPVKETFGDKADTIISSHDINKSISLPRVSPDGKRLMFTASDYGCFPSYNPEADLWMLDLSTGRYEPLDSLNSSSVDSWHSWSSEGRWIAFSSRRGSGLYSNIYLAFIDENGIARKPFILPQKDPSFYDDFLFSFNVPEFIRSEIQVNIYDIEKVAKRGPAVQVSSESGH